MQKTLDSIHCKSCTSPSQDRALEHFTALKFPKSTFASIIFKMEEITGTPARSGHLTETWLSCVDLVCRQNKVAEGRPSLQDFTSLSYQVARQNLSTLEGPPGFWKIIKKQLQDAEHRAETTQKGLSDVSANVPRPDPEPPSQLTGIKRICREEWQNIPKSRWAKVVPSKKVLFYYIWTSYLS